MQIRLILLFMFMTVSCFSQEVTSFTITGNKKTKTAFIKRIIQLNESSKLDSLLLDKDMERLKRLPGISYAYYTVNQNENDFEVIYHIEESFSILPSVNFYTTNMGEFAYRIGLYEFNGFGRNLQFGGFFQRDVYNSYAILFKASYLFSSQFGLAVSHQNLTTLEPLYFNFGSANYKYNNISVEALLLYAPTIKHRIEIGANYFVEKYQFVEGITDESVPQELKIHKTLFKFLYEFSNVKSNYQYMEGLKSQFRFQYVEEVNAVSPSFLIGVNDLFYYHQTGKKGTWASRFRIGFASNNDTPFAPFALDNNINIRGVGNTIDRGTASIVLNTELRYSLIDKENIVMQSNIFLDSGTWREPGGTFADFTQAENIKIYPGVGMRFILKKIFNAILRIDYGYGVSKNATNGFVFGIGQYF